MYKIIVLGLFLLSPGNSPQGAGRAQGTYRLIRVQSRFAESNKMKWRRFLTNTRFVRKRISRLHDFIQNIVSSLYICFIIISKIYFWTRNISKCPIWQRTRTARRSHTNRRDDDATALLIFFPYEKKRKLFPSLYATVCFRSRVN